LVKTPPFRKVNKLSPNWDGPYTLVRYKNQFQLVYLDRFGKEKITHRSRAKWYYSDQEDKEKVIDKRQWAPQTPIDTIPSRPEGIEETQTDHVEERRYPIRIRNPPDRYQSEAICHTERMKSYMQ
jgi:hypothetical protein